MHIDISLQDGVPIYRQIATQIKYLIASGQLVAGDELPTIRGLAEQLLVTPNTIVKAYDALEQERLLTKRQGAGTFVAALGSRLSRKEQKKILAQRADTLLAEANQMNFDLEEIIRLVRARQSILMQSISRGKSDDTTAESAKRC